MKTNGAHRARAREQGPVTGAERRAFARKIRRLIKDTNRLSTEKIDAALRILRDAQQDVIARMQALAQRGVPEQALSLSSAREIKAALERRINEFTAAAQDAVNRGIDDMASFSARFGTDLLGDQVDRLVPILDIPTEVIQNVSERSSDLIRSLSAEQVGRASDIINRAVLTGDSIFETTQKLVRAFGRAASQMETIARTEMMTVASQVHQAEIRAFARSQPRTKKQWVAVIDQRTRSGHVAAHLDEIRQHDEPFRVAEKRGGSRERLMFPRDPNGSPGNIINCFLPDTGVQGRVLGAAAAAYDGEAIEVVTADGRGLRVTPGHRVLTTRGFRRAGDLETGDEMVTYGRADALARSEEPIDSVFAVFQRARGVHRFPPESVPVDMHGDEANFKSDLAIATARVSIRSAAWPRGPETGPREWRVEPAMIGDLSDLPAMAPSAHSAILSAELCSGVPGFGSSRVIGVRRFPYTGPVMDVQTDTGWLAADGIVASNCRCVMVPIVPGREDLLTQESLPPVEEPLRGLGAEVAADLRRMIR